ncbi:dinitrogenase iron-molybdenum cofactor biosynthesis protein [Parazoarcus communis]|uniref:Dinitrogenase iron-molybdenum cofactor biosynthesis protein n=1 Tax=Parazoarcus communis SWub3 = DSM 12120 TaxID=1121029 RepID=A0A323UR73_9RHOO|nr:dinitrogenase iron-molybdenum cofactor biosynthesis protein [Parazoarcus communis]NMG71251.1 dinitrogenase iron-molybdenum cofactor biosynthesis protein [Parazoarcus communis SWub3 = DSM 12120]PZA15014.1 dinitrogenase iron-molybdenum cofactor biosynthesis protein [Azoarcus communis] [Parazoarcus communis SWub3 = DSM 12120]
MQQSAAPITREAALRIALAGRAMPGISLPLLIDVLQNRIGKDEIDADDLRTVTVTDLKTAFASADGEEDGEDIGIGLEAMKLAVRILWGDTEGENLPPIQPYDEGDMPDSVRVALASDSGEALNGHFGSCMRYLVYQVSAQETRLVGVRDALEADFAEDKNGFRVQLISDCHVLYVVSVGGPAAAKVIKGGIYPIKRIEGGAAAEVLAEFQQMMTQSPPPWLAKILGVDAGQRLKNYNAATIDE